MNNIVKVSDSPLATHQASDWDEVAGRRYSKNSRRAYTADIASLNAWLAVQGLQLVTPLSPKLVVDFLRYEANAGRKLATIRHRAAAITLLHRRYGMESPCEAELVRMELEAITKEKGTDQKQAPELNGEHATRIALAVEASAKPKDVRDLALMLVGRDLLTRASELVSIDLEAVTFDPDGTALVAMRRRKTSSETHQYMLGPTAAAALHRWLEVAGIQSGPLFVGLTKGGKLTGNRLVTSDVSRILKKLGKRARIKTDFSSHSVRIGMAVDLVADGVNDAAVMQAAGWQSPEMLTRYTRKLSAKRGAIAQYYGRKAK